MPVSENHAPGEEIHSDARFEALKLDLLLRQGAQAVIDNETHVKDWRELAEKAHRANLKRTQIRGLENVVNTAQSLATIVNYIFNQISRLKEWRPGSWGETLAKRYEGLPVLADRLLDEDQNPNTLERALQRQNLVLLLARGLTAHFVAYNLFLGSLRHE